MCCRVGAGVTNEALLSTKCGDSWSRSKPSFIGGRNREPKIHSDFLRLLRAPFVAEYDLKPAKLAHGPPLYGYVT